MPAGHPPHHHTHLLVDLPRYAGWSGFRSAERTTLVATVGVLIGTVVGGKLLARIRESVFRKVVAVIITILGIAVLSRAMAK